MSFAASLTALSVMTVISVAIGRCFRHVPAFLQSSLPIGEWAGAAMMVYFGIRTLRVRRCCHLCFCTDRLFLGCSFACGILTGSICSHVRCRQRVRICV